MSWHCSQALVEEFSAGNCLDGEQCARLKLIRTAEKSCFDGKKTGSYRRSLSGMTYEPSTADLGVERWMSSLPDSHASRSVLQASNEVKTMNATSGPTLSEYFAKYDHDTHCWRTSQGLLGLDIMEPFSEDWPKAGSMRNGECSERTMSVPTTGGSAFGWFATPTKTANQLCPSMMKHPGCRAMWPTPNAADAGRKGADYAKATRPGSGGDDLQTAVLKVERFPSPACRDYRSPNKKPYAAQGGGKKGEQLPNKVGGKLNPTWVEWLMGWPLGWTDLKPLETGKFQQWLEQHGSC